MTDARLRADDVRAMEERIVVTVDDEVEQVFQQTRDDPFFFYPGSVSVDVDGQTQRAVHLNPRGYDPATPLTSDEVVRKFVSTVVGAVGVDDADAAAFADYVLTCPDAEPVSNLMSRVATLLAGAAGATGG
jgi:2-methylcitrate dehydratase PrpD